jgi:predicted anti-sigma-YlaC factor YlaD
MMTCRTATDLHTEAGEGKLSGLRKVRYAIHMAACSFCRRYRSQLEATIEVLRRVPREEAPEDLVRRLATELEKKS